MDIVNPEFYFSYNFANQYALLWTPNAYRDMLMRIFTPCLFFQCVFTNFQRPLRALSVALGSGWYGILHNCIMTLTRATQGHIAKVKVSVYT